MNSDHIARLCQGCGSGYSSKGIMLIYFKNVFRHLLFRQLMKNPGQIAVQSVGFFADLPGHKYFTHIDCYIKSMGFSGCQTHQRNSNQLVPPADPQFQEKYFYIFMLQHIAGHFLILFLIHFPPKEVPVTPHPGKGEPSAITLLDIYKAVEGDKSLLHLDTHTNPECGVGIYIQLSLQDYFDRRLQKKK